MALNHIYENFGPQYLFVEVELAFYSLQTQIFIINSQQIHKRYKKLKERMDKVVTVSIGFKAFQISLHHYSTNSKSEPIL